MSYNPPPTKHLTSPPNPPPSTPSSQYPSYHPSHTQPAPFPTLAKPFDPSPASRPASYPYPTHLTLPSANPPPAPASAITSLGHKQLTARTIERPWAGMGPQQGDPTRETHTLSSGSRPHSTSASRQSYPSTSHQSYPSTSHHPSTSASHHSSPQPSRVNPLARWRAEPTIHGPYHALAEASPPPRCSNPSMRPYQQGHTPSRASATRGSWDGYEG